MYIFAFFLLLKIFKKKLEFIGLLGWSNVHGFDMSCVKELAMREPLVDSVNQEQIITNHCLLFVGLTLDISNEISFVRL